MNRAADLIDRLRNRGQVGHARRGSALCQALALQMLILERSGKPKTTDSALASLARSWCLVQDCVRVLRGQPLPGQLRPDLDPVQMAKALKRARARKPIDLLPAFGQSSFSDGDETDATAVPVRRPPGRPRKLEEQPKPAENPAPEENPEHTTTTTEPTT